MTDAVTKGLQPIPLHGMLFDVAGASAQGPRAENQDAFDVDAFATRGIVAVADGMGGERAGRLAADTALGALVRGEEIRSLDAARYAVRFADEAVARLAQESPGDRGGMGCALALMALTVDRAGDAGWIGAHVGDVRILSRTPDGTVRLETRDHTPAYARWEAGEIALDEIPDSPGANRLQRAVGRGGEAEASWIPVRPGWTYLLISDGVTKAMRLDELGDAMALDSARAVCEAVTRKVEERGPDDNYTAVAVRVLDGGGDTMPAPPARPSTPAATSTTTTAGGRDAHAPPRNLMREETDVNAGRRGGGILPLLLALLALGLAGYAAWAASQNRGADPALTAQLDSLRAEVAAMRAAAAPVDTLAVDSTAAAVTPGGPVPQAGIGAPQPAPTGTNGTTPNRTQPNRTTQP
ncbi:PP2C family protein-serine/threonine phosphatase [Longimicrobium sp.]|uniref:PP2C family protein-serine/threonine phosphatase n=1 Tax=Longimicrobium sp. TaxID=2029185 RepID=UPI002E347EF9|nr:protein phosphatase 2C domain-containing protein [Longimicrobium sp.]HEX6038276.1 protein phosphatase 2C domain-containing protein [Longimicrobium sp.]